MNILIAAKHLRRSNGGVCTHILDLCRELIKSGHHVLLLADGTDYSCQIMKIEGVTYSELPFEQMQTHPGILLSCYRNMKRLCRKHHIQILHLHGQCLIPIAWMIRMTMGIPFLWTNHIDAIPQADLLRLMQKFMRFPVISVSEDLKSHLVKDLGMRKEDISVINNGILPEAFPLLSTEERIELADRFSIQPDSYVISELARLTPVKGQDLLIKAVETVQKDHPERKIKVLFAGDGDKEWFQKYVMDYAAERGIDAVYLGFQSPRDVFGMSQLSVLPSLYEGFGLVCAEAMAMECPVVRSDSPGWSDMKDCCLVFGKNDLLSLTEKIEYAVTHQKEMCNMAAAGKQLCSEKFTVQHMTEKTIDIYQRLIQA